MPMLSSEINAASGAGTNGGRRPTVVPAPDAADAEFAARARRRTFSAADKLRILADVDRAAPAGGIGAVLRREGLYSSTLGEWRRLRDAGAFGALTPARRGPKVDDTNPLTAKIALLEKDNARLMLRLTRAEAIIDLQKKVAELLGIPLASSGDVP